MSKYHIQPMAWALHEYGKSPVYADFVTHVAIDDEAGGPFVVISQNTDDAKLPKIKLNSDEIDPLIKMLRMAKRHCIKLEEQDKWPPHSPPTT